MAWAPTVQSTLSISPKFTCSRVNNTIHWLDFYPFGYPAPAPAPAPAAPAAPAAAAAAAAAPAAAAAAAAAAVDLDQAADL